MVDIEIEGYPAVIFGWCLLAVATAFVAMRLFIQFKLRRRLTWAESFVITAWILSLIDMIAISFENAYDEYNTSIPFDNTNFAHWTPALKADFVDSLVYKPALYACKAALLCFYGELVPRQKMSKTWWTLVFTWVWVAIGALFQIFFILLHCRPLWVYWTPAMWGDHCVYWVPFIYASWSLHLFTDLLVYTIPFFIIRSLRNLSKADRRGAYGMFAFGLLNVISAIFMVAWTVVNVAGYDMNNKASRVAVIVSNSFIASFQLGTAQIIICLPYCRRFWQWWKAPKSEMSLVEVIASENTTEPDIETGRHLSRKMTDDAVELAILDGETTSTPKASFAVEEVSYSTSNSMMHMQAISTPPAVPREM